MLPPGAARVLDVGAGPNTRFGTFVPGRGVEFVAVEPLADIYAAIIATAGVTVPLPTRFSFGEDVSARFAADSFDLVLCSNALDHSIEPMRCLIEMLILARPGAPIILMHGVDETEREAYSGFHQWNFQADENGHFIIWNRERRLNATMLLASFASVVSTTENNCIHTIMTKQAPMPLDHGDYHRRMRAGVLRAVLGIC